MSDLEVRGDEPFTEKLMAELPPSVLPLGQTCTRLFVCFWGTVGNAQAYFGFPKCFPHRTGVAKMGSCSSLLIPPLVR